MTKWLSRLRNALRVVLITVAAALFAWLPFHVYERMDAGAVAYTRERVQDRNAQPTLRVGVMVHPTVYYLDPNGERTGLEFDLANAFAITRRSSVEWKTFANPDDARASLARGELDFVAIGAYDTGAQTSSLGNEALSTKTRYRESAWTLLYTPQKYEPKSLAELLPKRVVVSSRIFSHPRFATIQKQNPKVEFVADTRNDDEALIASVGDDEVPYAIVEDDTFNASRHFHYDTQRAFTVQPPLSRVWLFASRSESLRDEADQFLQRVVREGTIAHVLDRYFGFPQSRRGADFEIFSERIGTVLPRYSDWFKEAQERYGIEWRLLAALAYQESHWNAVASSETGAHGLMQFTEDTAKRYGVDRRDPYSSIIGGARYLMELKRDGLPPRISEPDKTWLALAAYNIGLAHVENARILAQRAKKNPDAWIDVRRQLLTLTRPEISEQFKTGPCRCGMPVDFVESIRAYYDILLRTEPAHQSRLRVPSS
jgi:membrane-bound lytic murein transglycosylase F